MDIEIEVNGDRCRYTQSLDSRLRHRIAASNDSGRLTSIVVFLTGPGVNLVLAFPRSALDDDPSIIARPLGPFEKSVVEQWDRCGLSNPTLSIDRLIEFLHIVKP
ncbi:MAG: hypothetical protein EON58_08290 [Alphaproteobacteria bacterium]|nr:MAG: hypothetical protein EON58_08290 [Alphaproteobacteria bacterium]